jgi:hypothetical protein
MSDNLGEVIDITTGGEYGDEDEVKVVMTVAQFDKLVELLGLVDLDAVRHGNDDLPGANFVEAFLATATDALFDIAARA